MNEIEFIAALRSLPLHPGARSLRDDCAVLEIGGETLILTHDTMVEGVHFLPDQDLADVAYRLVATNLSDLAAKGARPLGVLLSHCLGADDARFIEGLEEALREFQCPLLGGDTVSGPSPRSYGLTALGKASSTPVPSRSGALVDDAVYLSGPVGAAMMGFEALQAGSNAPSLAYRRPKPLIEEGILLAPMVSAIMDVSDGVLLDAQRLAMASGVTIALDTARIPIAAPPHRRDDALRWGDDYQLLFTANRAHDLPLLAYRIGEVRAQGDYALLIDETPPPEGDSLGYTHKSG